MLRAVRAGYRRCSIAVDFFARDFFEPIRFFFLATPCFTAARFLIAAFLPKADSQPAENFSVDPVRTMVKILLLRRFQ